MITLDNIGYRVGKSWACARRNIQHPPRRVLGFSRSQRRRQNNAAKRLMSGELAPSEGEARLRGKPRS